jgi:hypothetical protein
MQVQDCIDKQLALIEVDDEWVTNVELHSYGFCLLIDSKQVFRNELLDLQVDLLALNVVHV